MNLKSLLFIACLLAISGCLAPHEPTEHADTVYTNGKIYTVDPSRPWVEGFAIKDGEFLAVGTDAEVKRVRVAEVFDRPIQSQDDLDAALEQLRDALQKLFDEGSAIILE